MEVEPCVAHGMCSRGDSWRQADEKQSSGDISQNQNESQSLKSQSSRNIYYIYMFVIRVVETFVEGLLLLCE